VGQGQDCYNDTPTAEVAWEGGKSDELMVGMIKDVRPIQDHRIKEHEGYDARVLTKLIPQQLSSTDLRVWGFQEEQAMDEARHDKPHTLSAFLPWQGRRRLDQTGDRRFKGRFVQGEKNVSQEEWQPSSCSQNSTE